MKIAIHATTRPCSCSHLIYILILTAILPLSVQLVVEDGLALAATCGDCCFPSFCSALLAGIQAHLSLTTH